MTAQRRTVALQALISLVALAGVVWWATRQHLPELDTGHAAGGLLAAVALYGLATLARGERWHRVLLLVDGRSSRPDAYSLTTVGYMGNNTLPARAGDVLKSVLTARRTGLSTPEVLGAAVAERVLDATALGAIFLVLGGLVLTDAGLPAVHAVVAILAGLVLITGAALALPRVRRGHPRLQRAIALATALLRPSRALLSPTGGWLLVGTVLIWVVEATVYATVAKAVDLPLQGLDALYLVALTNLVALIPAAPGYVGTFDAAVVFGVKALTNVGGGTYVLALRLVLFVPITLAGLTLLIVRHGGLATLRTLRTVPAQSAWPPRRLWFRAMGFDQYHEPPEELSAETRTFARLCASLTEEAEAIGWYEQRIAVEKDQEALAVMRDAQGEEFKHFAMDLEFLLRRTPLWREIAEGILFQEGDIVEHGEEAEEDAIEGAAARGEPLAGSTSLGIGGLSAS